MYLETTTWKVGYKRKKPRRNAVFMLQNSVLAPEAGRKSWDLKCCKLAV